MLLSRGGLEGQLRQRLVQELEGRLGGHVELGELHLVSSEELVLEALVWTPAGGPIARASVERLELRVDAATLLDGEPVIEGAKVVSPHLEMAAAAEADEPVADGGETVAEEGAAAGPSRGTEALRTAVALTAKPLPDDLDGQLARLLARLSPDGVYRIEGGGIVGLPGGHGLAELDGTILTSSENLSIDLAGVLDSGGTVSLALDLSVGLPPSGRLDVQGASASLLTSALPRARQIRLEGGAADLTLTSRPDGRTGSVLWTATLALVGVTAHTPAFPDLPWPIETRHRLEIAPDAEGERVDLRDWRWSFNGVSGTSSGKVLQLSQQPEIRLVVGLDAVPYTDLIRALPPGTIPDEWGIYMGGTLDLTLRFGGPLQDRSAWDLGWKGDWSRASLQGMQIGESILRLRDNFPYTIVVDEETVLHRTMGPSDPHFIGHRLINADIISAVVVSEDASFYKHHGFDERELREALLQNVREGEGRGASTITQQVVKNLFLSGERTLTRKVREAVLTFSLEQVLDKGRIMEIYLNLAEFGPGIYGVRDAAHHYFGTSSGRLNTMECVFIATLLPSPVRYHDYYHPKGGVSSRWDEHMHQVLDRMHSQTYLVDHRYEVARTQLLRFVPCDGGHGP